MSHNTFGHLFRVTTFGESHGVAIGCVVDGCPPLIPLTADEIQRDLDRRRPGQSRFTTQRQEPDQVKILSGVMEHPETGAQVTTGTPIALLIDNTDQRSKDYSDIKDKFRPGHADFTYDAKYGLRDYRGGGRSSARETAIRVAAGAIARKILPDVTVRGALVQMGPHKIDRTQLGLGRGRRRIRSSAPIRSARNSSKSISTASARAARRSAPSSRSSPTACRPAGARRSTASSTAILPRRFMSINAVKGVEIGAGFAAAALSGEDNADEMRMGNDGATFLSNNAGGIFGGISTGQPVVARFAVKPTSSILTPRRTIDRAGQNTEIMTKGRHDPCVGIRAVPVGEAMMAIVLADHFLRHRGQVGR